MGSHFFIFSARRFLQLFFERIFSFILSKAYVCDSPFLAQRCVQISFIELIKSHYIASPNFQTTKEDYIYP